jgi:DNA topoisomerase I
MVVPFDRERPSGDSRVLRSHPPTATPGSPQIRERTSKRLVGIRPAAYNTAIIPIGNESGSCARPADANLIDLMPGIRRSITKLLKQTEIDREFAAAALVDLIACTAIRPGSETYVRERGTRGAATLLKRHIQIRDDEITLRFPGKGGKQVEKVCRSDRLVKTIRRLQKLPGNRLFQYVSDDGSVRRLRRRDANAFLCKIANNQISLKDFRTLSACSQALAHLSRLDPKPSQRGKRAQIGSALRQVASDLANTPAVCKRSYVHALVIHAFETGRLKKLAPNGRLTGGTFSGHRLLKKILRSASAFRM